MLKKGFLVAAVVVLVLGIANVAVATPIGRNISPWEMLNLADSQYEKIEDVQGGFFSALQDLMEKVIEKREGLRKLYLQKEPDEAAIESLEGELLALQGEILRARRDKHYKINDIFTPEQWDEIESFRGEDFGSYGFGHHGMMGFGHHRGLNDGIPRGFGHGGCIYSR